MYKPKNLDKFYRRDKLYALFSCKEISTTFLNIRDDLLEVDKEMEMIQKFKCPELENYLNNTQVVKSTQFLQSGSIKTRTEWES